MRHHHTLNIISTFVVLFICNCTYSQEQPNRLGRSGFVKWDEFRQTGDMALVRIVPKEVGEELTVAMYLEMQQAANPNQRKPDEQQWKPVPCSKNGDRNGFYSEKFGGVRSMRGQFVAATLKPVDTCLYIPIDAYSLPIGEHFLRLRVRVFSGSDTVDDKAIPEVVHVKVNPIVTADGGVSEGYEFRYVERGFSVYTYQTESYTGAPNPNAPVDPRMTPPAMKKFTF